VENIRLHYSRTLEIWAQRFERHKAEITEMMDEEFVKAWGLYLYGSIAAFKSGGLQLYQVVFNHTEYNNIPWSRHHLYEMDVRTTGKTKLAVVSSDKEQIDEIL